MAKSVRESKKNFWISVAGAIVLISLAAYLILPNLLTKTDSPSQSLEQAVNSRTAYTFVKQGELSFNDSKSNFITRIEIEIADTDDKRTTGLMFRDKMDETQGMLFIFPRESEQAFWMKNTILLSRNKRGVLTLPAIGLERAIRRAVAVNAQHAVVRGDGL